VKKKKRIMLEFSSKTIAALKTAISLSFRDDDER